MTKKVIVSACLWGQACRYDGQAKSHDKLLDTLKCFEVILICPEEMGGLETPRPPAEIISYDPLRVINKRGEEVTLPFKRGADVVCLLAKYHQVDMAILKARSPSCGYGQIYDGSFTHTLVGGDGVTSHALKKMGVTIFTEETWFERS